MKIITLSFLAFLYSSISYSQGITTGDTLVFSEVTTDDGFDLGCHFYTDPNDTPYFDGGEMATRQRISCDTIAEIRRIYVDENKNIFFHENPRDTFEHNAVWYHSLPHPIFSLKIKNHRVYYESEKTGEKDILQMSLIKNDTVNIHSYYIDLISDSHTFQLVYTKDTVVRYHNKKVSCYLFWGSQYITSRDSEGLIHIYRFCIDKKNLIPLYTTEESFFLKFYDVHPYYKHNYTSCIFLKE